MRFNFFDLFLPQCEFCLTNKIASPDHLTCQACLPYVLNLMQQPALYQTPLAEKPLYFLDFYQNWFQQLILRQKKLPSPVVLKFIAEIYLAKVVAEFKRWPIVFVPAKPWSALHLVEAMVLEFSHFDSQLVFANLLSRNFWRSYFRSAQKNQTQQQRHLLAESNIYQIKKKLRKSNCSLPKQVVLFDDIATTGSTLWCCESLLKQHAQIEVMGYFSLAYTPKKNYYSL